MLSFLCTIATNRQQGELIGEHLSQKVTKKAQKTADKQSTVIIIDF